MMATKKNMSKETFFKSNMSLKSRKSTKKLNDAVSKTTSGAPSIQKSQITQKSGSAVPSASSRDVKSTATTNDAELTTEMARELTINKWFHGMMPRDEIEELLKSDGDFLLRKTDVKGKSKLAISVYYGGRTRHILISHADGMWCIRNLKKKTLQELVDQHIQTKTPVQGDGTILKTPIARPEFYILHEHIEIKKNLVVEHLEMFTLEY